jgi:hypothetical protein
MREGQAAEPARPRGALAPGSAEYVAQAATQSELD